MAQLPTHTNTLWIHCLPSAPVYPGRTHLGQDLSEDTELLFIQMDTTAFLYVLNGSSVVFFFKKTTLFQIQQTNNYSLSLSHRKMTFAHTGSTLKTSIHM